MVISFRDVCVCVFVGWGGYTVLVSIFLLISMAGDVQCFANGIPVLERLVRQAEDLYYCLYDLIFQRI